MTGINFEPVSVEDVKKLLASEPKPVFTKREDPFKALRRRQAEAPLQGYAQSWLNAMPHQYRPVLCAKKYPRIINKMAALWQDMEQTESYLFSLLVDTRGNRQGFPPGIAEELRLVRSYMYIFNNQDENSPWAMEGGKVRSF